MTSQYQFHTNCVSANGDDISEMQNVAGVGHQCREDLGFKELQQKLGADFWQHYADSASFFKNDPYINAHQSSYQGFPCVYIRASGIEHIYIQNNSEHLLGNGYFASFHPFDSEQTSLRQQVLDAMEEHPAIEAWAASLLELCQTVSDAQHTQLKGENYSRTLTRMISSNSELFQRTINHYNQLTSAHNASIQGLRITPATILSHCRPMHHSLWDKACTLMDLINTRGPSFGLDLTCMAEQEVTEPLRCTQERELQAPSPERETKPALNR